MVAFLTGELLCSPASVESILMLMCVLVGYGDLLPTTTAGRILLFPVSLMGIALLGSIVQMLVAFFSSRSADRKARSRAKFERQRQIEEDKRQNPADLAREIEFLHQMNERQDFWDQLTEFAVSCFGFFAFWVVGAAIFMALEVRTGIHGEVSPS